MKRNYDNEKHWSVSVTSEGKNLLIIETNSLSGKSNLTKEDEAVIRKAALHLLSFIGEKESDKRPG